MKDDNKSSEADTQDELQTSGEGEENVGDRKKTSSDDSESSLKGLGEKGRLAAINELTGQNYKTLDDAKKGYNELKQLTTGISKLRKQAKEAKYFDSVVSQYAKDNKLSLSAARQYLKAAYDQADFEGKGLPDDKTDKEAKKYGISPDLLKRLEKTESSNAKLTRMLQRETLLKKYPEAKKFVSTIEMIARKEGKSLVKSYETSTSLNELRELITANIAREKKSKKEQNVLKTQRRVSPEKSRKIASIISELKKQEEKSPIAISDLKEKLVEEVLFGRESS